MSSRPHHVGGQAARFLVVGGFLTTLSAAIYWAAVRFAGVEPLLASIIGHLVGLLIGFRLHAQWTFAGMAQSRRSSAENLRFVLVSLTGLLSNLLWVELLVGVLGGPDWAPVVPMIIVTPALTFVVNRNWVFDR